VNITTQEQEYTDDYDKNAQDNIGEFEDYLLPTEDCNFLEGSPCRENDLTSNRYRCLEKLHKTFVSFGTYKKRGGTFYSLIPSWLL